MWPDEQVTACRTAPPTRGVPPPRSRMKAHPRVSVNRRRPGELDGFALDLRNVAVDVRSRIPRGGRRGFARAARWRPTPTGGSRCRVRESSARVAEPAGAGRRRAMTLRQVRREPRRRARRGLRRTRDRANDPRRSVGGLCHRAALSRHTPPPPPPRSQRVLEPSRARP